MRCLGVAVLIRGDWVFLAEHVSRVQAKFTERTDANHLRHSKFVGFRGDKPATEVTKEHVKESTESAPDEL
jgi:ATP-dependent DNA ligase